MDKVKDYTKGDRANSHYRGESSVYSRRVEEQNKMQPDYNDRREVHDGRKSVNTNTKQVGP